MKHIAVTEYGSSLGITGSRLVIKERGILIGEYALSRVKSVLVAKSGVSISSNCITSFAGRGIKLFITDFKGEIVSCLYDVYSHGSVAVRKKQFEFIASNKVASVASLLIFGKVRGQYVVLKYFSKYKTDANTRQCEILSKASEKVKDTCNKITHDSFATHNWKERLMGYEGSAACFYWQALVECQFFPESFVGRRGRGAYDIVNKSLNYGYAILSTIIINAIINAGLELYAGILHSSVPGKPALLLDVMEEYRAIVVDKAIIKIRTLLYEKKELDATLKKRIIREIYTNIHKYQIYHGRKIKLESIIQRQLYQLAAVFCGKKQYKPISYKW